MSRFFILWAFCLGLFLFAQSSFAQTHGMRFPNAHFLNVNPEVTENEVKELRQALALSYINNPGLRAERADLRATQEEYPQAIANLLPSLTWNSSVNANNIRGDTITGSADGAVAKEVGFSLSQPVFRGGRTFAEASEATNNIRAAEAALLAEEQDVFIDVVRAYLNIIRDRRSLEIQLRNQRVLERRLRNSQALFRAGEATRADVSQSRARLSGAQSEVVDAEVDLNASIEQFVNVVGVRPSETIEMPEWELGLPATLQEAQNIALNNNPDILEARFDYLAAQAAVKVEYRAFMPQLTLSANYRNQIDPAPANNKSRREQSLGLRMSVPFFQGGGQRSEVREAKVTANQQKLEMMQEIRDVMENVSDTWKEYESASRRVELRSVQVEAARDARNSVQREVEAGERTYVDLLDADQDLLDAELDLVLAERNVILESFNLLQLLGRLNADYLELDKEGKVFSPQQNMDRLTSVRGFLSMDTYEDEANNPNVDNLLPVERSVWKIPRKKTLRNNNKPAELLLITEPGIRDEGVKVRRAVNIGPADAQELEQDLIKGLPKIDDRNPAQKPEAVTPAKKPYKEEDSRLRQLDNLLEQILPNSQETNIDKLLKRQEDRRKHIKHEYIDVQRQVLNDVMPASGDDGLAEGAKAPPVSPLTDQDRKAKPLLAAMRNKTSSNRVPGSLMKQVLWQDPKKAANMPVERLRISQPTIQKAVATASPPQARASSSGHPVFVQVGIYSSYDEAREVSRSMNELGTAHVFSTKSGSGSEFFQVQIGPVRDKGQAHYFRHLLLNKGYSNARVSQ